MSKFVFGLTPVMLSLVACAWLEPATQLRVGQTETQVTQLMGVPGARHALAGGGVRLEFARGPAGQTTWMVDMDASGQLATAEQVLNEASFQRIVDGMPRDELLRLIGRPAHRQREWRDRETWSWRYPTNDCLWFRVTLSPQGQTLGGGGYMTDPVCDVNDNARDAKH